MFETIEKIEAALACLKQIPEADRLSAVVAALEVISTEALDGLQAARKARAMQEPNRGNDGFSPLASDIWVDGASCDVQARQRDDGRRDYLVLGRFGEATRRVIGASDSAPNSEMIGGYLLTAGLIRTEALPGHEWSLNIDCENPFVSSFPAEELRDCAFDELILDGKVPIDDDPVICFFEMEADGYQDEDLKFYVEPAEWVKKRGISLLADCHSTAAVNDSDRQKG